MPCPEILQHVQDKWERKERGKDERSDHRYLVSYLPCPLRNNVVGFQKRWEYLELQRKGKQCLGPNESSMEQRAGVCGWTGNGRNPRYLVRIQPLAEKKCFIAALCSLIKTDRENQKELYHLKRS